MTGRGRPPHDDILTPAEWRVVEAVRHGLSNRAIAGRRRISEDAVKFHVTNVLAKLGLKTRAQLRQWNGVAANSALHAREKGMTDTKLGPLGQVSRKGEPRRAKRESRSASARRCSRASSCLHLSSAG